MNENVVLNEQDILALPFVPLRGIVVYPKLVSHIDIGRDKSLAAVDYAMEHDRQLLVATQVDENEDNPGFDDVYTIGCLVKIEQLLRMPGGLVRILVNGISRVRMQGFSQKADYLEGAAVKVAEISRNEVEEEAMEKKPVKMPRTSTNRVSWLTLPLPSCPCGSSSASSSWKRPMSKRACAVLRPSWIRKSILPTWNRS